MKDSQTPRSTSYFQRAGNPSYPNLGQNYSSKTPKSQNNHTPLSEQNKQHAPPSTTNVRLFSLSAPPTIGLGNSGPYRNYHKKFHFFIRNITFSMKEKGTKRGGDEVSPHNHLQKKSSTSINWVVL